MTRLRALLWPLALILAILFTAALTARILSAIYEPELRAAYAERDRAVRERNALLNAFKRLVEGEPTEAMVAGRPSEGD
jgi:cell division protein FtsL